jgi:clan AA aspartic protease (TIGR02281 family)
MSAFSEEPGDATAAGAAWQARGDADWSSRLDGGGGMFRWAVVAGGVAVLASAVAIGAVAFRDPAPSAPATDGGRFHSETTLFYHPKNQLAISRSHDGNVHVDAKIGDRTVRFIVDPSVSTIVLSPEDARVAGLAAGALDYSDRLKTAGVETRIAPVNIRQLVMGELTIFDVPGAVAADPIPASVLGKTFLKRFSGYELEADRLVLHW